MNKKIKNILIIAAGYVVVFLSIAKLFSIPREGWATLQLGLGVAVLIGMVVVNLVRQFKFMTKVGALEKHLKAKEWDTFIEENEKLLQGKKNPYACGIIKINISVGYMGKKDYELAKKVLLEVDKKVFKDINKVIYYANLALVHFSLNEDIDALEICSHFGNDFQKFKTVGNLGQTIAINEIFMLIIAGKTDNAMGLLNHTKEKWPDNDYSEVEKRLAAVK